MKKLVALFLALTLCATLFVSFAVAEKPVKVYSISVMSGGAAWGRFEQGFNDACAELGWEGHYLAPSTANDATMMIQLTETALNDGADVIAVCVTDVGLFKDVLQRAKDAGVTLIGNVVGDPDLMSAAVGTDTVQLGVNTADTLVEMMGDKPIYVTAGQTQLSSEIQNLQVQAFLDRLAEIKPEAVVVDRFECNSVATTAADKISALYIAHPELNAVVSFDSYVGLGAASFVSDYGIQDDFLVLGIDDGAENLLAIKQGNMDATIAQQWYQIGRGVIEAAQKVLNGEEIEYTQAIPTVAIMPDMVDAYAAEAGISLE